MDVKGKGGGIDKGKAFNKAVAGSSLSQKSSSLAGRELSQRRKSSMVAQAFETASARTGTFKGSHAKK